MIFYHLLAITLAFFIDAIVGDPPNWPHPVRWMGNLIGRLDRSWNNGEHRKVKGVAMLVTVLFVVFIITLLATLFFYWIHPIAGVLFEGIIISTTIAQKSLKAAALEVYEPLMQQNWSEARLKLSYIVGRDTDQLDEAELTRGTVETVAENTSDGVTAPLFWALIGGAPLAIVYRAINTCDSMVGYKNEKYGQFGWASARLDDVANWIPSRLTGILMLIGTQPELLSYREAWSILFRDAKKHPSPNSGWCEAGCAVILGIQLGGINYYKGKISDRARMGDAIVPLQADHIVQANAIMNRTVLLFLLCLWIGGIGIDMAISWR